MGLGWSHEDHEGVSFHDQTTVVGAVEGREAVTLWFGSWTSVNLVVSRLPTPTHPEPEASSPKTRIYRDGWLVERWR